MLGTIIPYLEAKIDAAGIFQEINGLGELVVESERTSPNLYLSAGQYKKLTDFDHQSSFCYFRLTGAYTESNSEDEFIGGTTERIRTYPLKLVGYCGKDIYNTDDNYIDEKVASNVSLFISETEAETLATSLKADFVEISVTSTELRRKTVLDEEVSGDTSFINIPFDKVFFQIEFDVTVTGNIDCFDVYDCDDEPTDVIALIRDKYCEDIECADGTVRIINTNGTVLYNKSVASGATAEQTIADQTAQGTTGQGAITFPANTTGAIPDVDWTDSDGSSQSAPYGTNIVCTPAKDLDEYTVQELEDGLTETQRNAVSRLSLFKLGTPTVSYYNNDLGDNNPGRGVDFFTLSVNNPNGNNNRFELLGTDVVIDWAYRKYWTKNLQSFARWGDHNDNSEALTLEGLTTWRLPSVIEYLTIMNTFDGDPLNYSPFNIVNANQTLATSQTYYANTNNYFWVYLIGSSRGYSINTSYNKGVNFAQALYCKDF